MTTTTKPYVSGVWIEVLPDPDGDMSYLEQDEWKDRLEAYRRGEFDFVGVRVCADVRIPHGDGWVMQQIESPGLWSIESDSGEEYFTEVGREEVETLRLLLSMFYVDLPADVKPSIRYR